MKKIMILLLTLTFILTAFLSSCGDNVESSIASGASDSDNSSNTDRSNEEYVYGGDIEIVLKTKEYTAIVRHNTADVEDLRKIVSILNEGKWEDGADEFNTGYIIYIGERTVYYDELTGYFSDPERGMHASARQPNLGINKEMVNRIFNNATDIYANAENVYKKTIEDSYFKNDATGYKVVFTLAEKISAVDFETNYALGVTAMYDGSVTRFYNSETGEYLAEAAGKYLTICCDEGFCLGEYSLGSCDAVLFNNYKGELTGGMYTEDNHGHGGSHRSESLELPIYFTDYDDRVFAVVSDAYSESGSLKYFSENSYRVCRKAELSGPYPDEWESADEIPELESLSKYGVVYNGEVIIPFKYDIIDFFGVNGECRFGVYRAVKDGKAYYISTNGENLTPEGFMCGSQPYKNSAWVFDGEAVNIIEFTGDESLLYGGGIKVERTADGETVVTDEDAKDEISALVNKDAWQMGYVDCSSEYVLYIGGNGILYCPECGMLRDLTNNTILQLSEAETESLNGILDHE